MNVWRGEVWLVDLGEGPPGVAAYPRPVVIVSRDSFNSGRAPTVTVVPGTSTDRRIPGHVAAEPSETGLPKRTVFQPEQVATIGKEQLIRRVGALGHARMAELSARLASYLDLE